MSWVRISQIKRILCFGTVIEGKQWTYQSELDSALSTVRPLHFHFENKRRRGGHEI